MAKPKKNIMDDSLWWAIFNGGIALLQLVTLVVALVVYNKVMQQQDKGLNVRFVIWDISIMLFNACLALYHYIEYRVNKKNGENNKG